MKNERASEIGESGATDETRSKIDSLVDEVVGGSAQTPLEDNQDGLKTKDKPEDEIEEESGETETEEEVSSDDSDESKDSDEDEHSDEDVMPASKVKKMQEKMQKRIDALTAEREAFREQAESQAKTQEQKLELLSTKELQELSENVDDAIMDAKVAQKVDGEDMTKRITELKELKRAIKHNITEAPKKFAKRQLEHFQKMAETVKEIDPEVMSNKGELFGIAQRIYQRSVSLQRSETGQAEALAMAAEYYLDRKSLENGRSHNKDLSKKVSELKRKTALDGKTRTANADQVSQRKIRDKAVKGDYYDKLNFVQSLIPDDFLHT